MLKALETAKQWAPFLKHGGGAIGLIIALNVSNSLDELTDNVKELNSKVIVFVAEKTLKDEVQDESIKKLEQKTGKHDDWILDLRRLLDRK